MVRVQEELFPLVRLYERFEVIPTNTDPTESLVVLLESEGVQYCLLVDELLGMQQVVIKALEEELRGDRCLSGCAILGDGQVGLILDPSGLAALYKWADLLLRQRQITGAGSVTQRRGRNSPNGGLTGGGSTGGGSRVTPDRAKSQKERRT